MKTCYKCKETKSLSEFCKDKSKKDGLKSWCRDCSNKSNKKWYEDNPEYQKQWREDNPEYAKNWGEDNKEHLQEYHKNWEEDNKEHRQEYRDGRKEEAKKINKKWKKTPKGKYSTYKKGAKERGYEFNLSLEEFTSLLNQDCHYCGEAGGGVDRFDNSTGYTSDNCVPCCTMCNLMKLDHSYDDWLEKIEQILIKDSNMKGIF